MRNMKKKNRMLQSNILAMKVDCPIKNFYFCSASRNLAGMKGSIKFTIFDYISMYNFPFVSTQEIRIIKNYFLFVMTCITVVR